jgi:hypothetical protein
MDDAAIRAALRELGEVKLGVPSGHVSVPPDALDARGFNSEEVACWVDARGGDVHRSERPRPGKGQDYGKLDVWVHLVVPEEALSE